jgi:hypothetical protein
MGIPVASTACDSPYYHTSADTPEKVDADQLARAVVGFDRTLDALLASDPRGPRLPHHDLDLWRADVALSAHAGEPLRILVRDAHGVPQPGVAVETALLEGDFFLADEQRLVTDAAGEAFLLLPSAEGRRWLHVGAGPSYPLCEAILPV